MAGRSTARRRRRRRAPRQWKTPARSWRATDECSTWRGVAHPRHEFLGARSGRRSERVPGVPKIVKAQAVDAATGDATPRSIALVAGAHPFHRRKQGRRVPAARSERDGAPASVRSFVGRATTRRPAADFGGPTTRCPPTPTACSTTRTCPRPRSRWRRRKAASSPQRSVLYVAIKTSARKRGSIALAIAATCTGVAIGRSSVRSTPAPLITQGFLAISLSSSAVVRTVFSSR